MKITSGNVTIKKDNNNLIGISIGGGAPFCPCLYIVQVLSQTFISLLQFPYRNHTTFNERLNLFM